MITVYPVLRQRMRDQNITYKELAAVVGINRMALCLSMWGIRRWKLTEAIKICSYFRTNDVENIFVRNHFKSQ